MTEIPADLTTCGVKDLKSILEGLGIGSDDCFEKADMILKIQTHQNAKKAKRRNTEAAPKPPQGPKSAASNKENAAPK